LNTAAPKMWCAPQAPGYNITETHDRCKDEQFYCGWKLTCTAGFHPKVCHRPMIGIGYWAAWNDCMVGTMLPLMSTRTCNGCWWISGDNCPSQYVQAFGQFYQTMTSWTVSRMTHWNIVVFIIVQNGLYGFTDKSTPKHATTCQSLMLYHVHSHNPHFQRVSKANECRWTMFILMRTRRGCNSHCMLATLFMTPAQWWHALDIFSNSTEIHVKS